MTGKPVTIVRHATRENYTIVPNAIANDERITADEMAVLIWMLTRPPEWEVRRPVLKKRFGFGRDRLRRIFSHLRELKYSKQEAVRREDGTVEFYRITVADRPIFESHESTEIEADDDDPPDGTACDQVTEKTAADTHQVTPQPSPGNPSPEVNNDKIVNTPPTPRAGEDEAAIEQEKPSFKRLVDKWPGDHVLSRTAAERRFLRLTDAQQRAAVDRAAAYLADMRSRGWKVCDLATYLRDKRFERFVGTVPRTGLYGAKPGTPQYFRWHDYLRETGGLTAFLEQCFKQFQPVTVPSEWPPALPDRDSTGPPASPRVGDDHTE
jgi:hypothetical protein